MRKVHYKFTNRFSKNPKTIRFNFLKYNQQHLKHPINSHQIDKINQSEKNNKNHSSNDSLLRDHNLSKLFRLTKKNCIHDKRSYSTLDRKQKNNSDIITLRNISATRDHQTISDPLNSLQSIRQIQHKKSLRKDAILIGTIQNKYDSKILPKLMCRSISPLKAKQQYTSTRNNKARESQTKDKKISRYQQIPIEQIIYDVSQKTERDQIFQKFGKKLVKIIKRPTYGFRSIVQ